MHTANNIADFFISNVDAKSGDTISHLKLQKLVYYAQAWHFTLFGKPLFDEKIEAWKHGPVVRSIYSRFSSDNVYTPLNVQSIEIQPVEFEPHTLELLNDIMVVYGEHNASYLEDLTHSESPWIDARGSLPLYASCTNEITLESMRNYYSSLSGKE